MIEDEGQLIITMQFVYGRGVYILYTPTATANYLCHTVVLLDATPAWQ